MKEINSRIVRGRRMDKHSLSLAAKQFLYDDTLEPPGSQHLPRPLSPPIFPRRSANITQTKAVKDQWNREAVANLVRTAGPPLDTSEWESKENTAREHMSIIDGWSMLVHYLLSLTKH